MVRQVRKERSNADIEGGVRLSASGDIDARARCMLTLLFVSSIALAQQQPDSLTALQQAAEQRTSEWDGLARTLEGKIARMLPCDARVRTTIEEVNRASDARLAALGKYLQAAASEASAASQLAARTLAEQEGLARELELERAEADQQRIAVDAQLSELAESLKRRGQLAEAQKTLAAIAELVRQRVAGAQQQAAKRAALVTALRELTGAYQAREKSLQTESAALAIEASRWGDYYAARIARAHTECSITNQWPSRPLQRKKQ